MIEIEPLSAANLCAAVDLAVSDFLPRSVLHQCLAIEPDNYRNYICANFQFFLARGMSSCAVNPQTGEVVGCIMAADYHDEFPPELVDSLPEAAPLHGLIAELRAEVARHRAIDPGTHLHLDLGVVRQDFMRRGIYEKLRRWTQTRGHQSGFGFVCSEMSSRATQNLALGKLGQIKIAEVFYEKFKYRGRRPFAGITEPPSCIFAAGSLA